MFKDIETFTVYRKVDSGGVSGTGRVIDGVVFNNGWVVICWRTDSKNTPHDHQSIAMYPSWESFKFIHIDSHPQNDHLIVYGEDAQLEKKLEEMLKNIAPSISGS